MVQNNETTQPLTSINERGPLDDEDAEASVRLIRKAIALLLTRKKPEETIYISSPEGLRLMHLRYEIDEKTVHKVCLMFKRSPELKPYYKAIKSWCEDNKFQWKAKVFNHNRYMEIPLNPYLDEITKTIFDAKQTIFNVKKISVGTSSPDLSLSIQGLQHPYLIVFFGIGGAASVALLPIYEIFRLPYFGAPSLNALDWPEIFLMSWLAIGLVTIRRLNRDKTRKKPKKPKTFILVWTALSLIAGLTFFTH